MKNKKLNRIISESIRKVLNETWEQDFNNAMDKQDYLKAQKEYDSKSWFQRILAMIGGNKPKDPNTAATLEELLNKYVESFNKEHNIGRRTDFGGGETFHSRMGYADDGYPVLTATHYDPNTGTAAQSRKKYNQDGKEEEWGITYPYSEFGYTMDNIPASAHQDAKHQYGAFNKNRDEVQRVIKNRRNTMNRKK